MGEKVEESEVGLDGELAFYHSNIGLEPESQSFEFDDNDLNENHNAKDPEKRVSIGLKPNKGDSDVLLPYDMEVEDGLTASELDDPHINIMIDLKNDNEVKVRDFIEPVPHSSRDIEVNNSPIVPVSNPLQEAGSFKNLADIYTDKSVLECEPELVVCYKESSYHDVKDICVDEGIPTKDKILFENNVSEEAGYKFLPPQDYQSEKSTKDNIGRRIDVPFPVLVDSPATGESDEVSTNLHKSTDLMSSDRETVSAEESHTQVSSEPEMHSKLEESEDRDEEGVSTSLLTLAVDESNGEVAAGSDGNTPENGSVASQFDPPATLAKEESHRVGGLKCDDTQNSSEPSDRKSDDQAVTSHFRHSLGESSFSAVGQISNRISYSGPVPYSDYKLNGIAAQCEWRKPTGDITGNTGVGGRAFYAVKEHEGRDFVGQKDVKGNLSGKQEQNRKQKMVIGRKEITREEEIRENHKIQISDVDIDPSQYFTMDYSRVRRRRPVHNKHIPLSP
ncbi:uncharacterized protein G2W53_019098 [Senna tora]|uniref:Uncharacterized protein n=1 Tax=Senna tora TaxID=362788 RepID=A0A834TUB8_9FABA|nr:uncharacterized protein G2W53_019098 [Senna tora]